MKRAFIDTNVILDYILQREHGFEAKGVISWLVRNNVEMMMSVGGFYTMHYVIDKYLRSELHLDKSSRLTTLRLLLTSILQTFTVAEHDNNTLMKGVNDLSYYDLEDSCQYQLAIAAGCDILVTLDIKHFSEKNDMVRVITPNDFKEEIMSLL